jgi:hypothetical protein
LLLDLACTVHFLLYDALNLASLRLCASAILVSFLAGVARGFFFPLSSFGLLPVRGGILFPRLGSAAWIGVYSLRFFPPRASSPISARQFSLHTLGQEILFFLP